MKHPDRKQHWLKSRIIKWLIITALTLVFACGAWILLTSVSLRKVRFVFNVDDPARFAALELASPEELHDWTLNGKPVPVPFERMQYDKIPAIPTSLLVKGENILQIAVPLFPQHKLRSEAPLSGEPFDLMVKNHRFAVHVSGLTAKTPCLFTIGPVLGFAGADFFTVACQTNMPVPVRLEVDGRVLESPAGAVHSWRVDGLQPERDYEYRLTTVHPLTKETVISRPHHVKTFTTGDKLSFVACGDNRSHPEIWGRVAALIRSQNPAFFTHTGDLVKKGFFYTNWLREMFEPAAGLLASVPMYPVIGDHEHNAEIFQRMFQTSTVATVTTNWQQRIGPIHLIGINGKLDWRTGSKPYVWLSGVLSASNAPFIFLVTHWPPFCSTWHGKVSGNEPVEKTAREARDYILPLLAQYHVTAIIAGHSHSYERSELDGGVTLITTAGAGAGLMNERKNAQKQNPYSKIFVKAYNITVFQIQGMTCEMKALDLDGKVLDTRTWQARNMQPEQAEPKKKKKAFRLRRIFSGGWFKSNFPPSAQSLQALCR